MPWAQIVPKLGIGLLEAIISKISKAGITGFSHPSVHGEFRSASSIRGPHFQT
jgi:hypothetical protein